MKFKINTVLFFLLICHVANAQKIDVKKAFASAGKQTDLLIRNVDSARLVKPQLVSPGLWKKVSLKW